MKLYLCSLVMFVCCSTTMAQKPIVVIDPGHGGPDSGAIGTNGILEKEVVLDIAKQCLLLNRSLFQDSLEIYLTRYTDTLVSLGTRTRLAKALGADAFVSLHCNQAPNKKAQGFEIFLFHGQVNPTVVVPAGVKVRITLGNAESTMPHGLAVTRKAPPYPANVKSEIKPPIAGTGYVDPTQSKGKLNVAGTGWFTLKPGTYYYVCPVPTHAKDGMYGKLVVKSSGG